MHSSFSEFEAYNAALGNVDVRLMLLRREQQIWEHDSLPVGSIHVQHGRTGSPLIAEAAADAGGRLFFVPVSGRHMINGQPSDDSLVLVVPSGADFTISVRDQHEWVAAFVADELLEASESRDPCAVRGSMIARPGREKVSRLRCLLTEILAIAAIEPTVLSEPAAVSVIQAELIAVCRAILGFKLTDSVNGRPAIRRSQIIRHAKKLIEGLDDMTIQIDDLAREADVSVRTLRNAFLEYYGVSPNRYFMLRRLHAARDTLRKAELEETTVTTVAAQFGFWQFGRFSGHYRRLFGELPSETLARTASAKGRNRDLATS